MTSDRLHVGLVCSAGAWNPSRAIAPQMLGPILATPGCDFWSLEGGPDRVQPATQTSYDLHEDALCNDSMMGLATLISQLDLVITVDTFAAHLAGALGVKTWILLQHQADWRWMHHRSDSPWYPTARLFRQVVQGDWTIVISDLLSALQAEAEIAFERKLSL